MFLLRGFRHSAALISPVKLICQLAEHKLCLFALIIIHNYAAEMVGQLAKNTPIHNNVQAPAPERPTAIINVCAPEVCAPEVCAPDVSAPEVCAPEVSAREASAPEVSAPEASALKVCAPDVSAPEASALKVSALEVSAPEVSTAPSIFVFHPLFVGR